MSKKKTTGLMKIGRPTVMTPDVVRKLEEAFCWDCTDEEACAYAGISERSYYDHKAADDVFSQRMERAKRVPFMLAKKTLMKALQEDDGALALKYLKNRQRDRYHEKVEEVITKPPRDHAQELADEMLKRAAAKATPPEHAQPV